MRKFKIAEVSLGYFVIVKADVVTSVMPVNVHGIIRITGTGGILKADLMSGMSNGLDAGGVSILIEFMDSALINRPIWRRVPCAVGRHNPSTAT